jgi:hypothetical protein
MDKIHLDLDKPIFAFYVDVSNLTRDKAEEIIYKYKSSIDIYSNITTWVIPSNRTEVICIFDGKYINRDSELSNLINEINKRIEILSDSKSFEDFKINIRNWRLHNIINGTEET